MRSTSPIFWMYISGTDVPATPQAYHHDAALKASISEFIAQSNVPPNHMATHVPF